LNLLISHSFRPHKRLHEAVRIVDALQKHLPHIKVTLHVIGADDGRSFAYAERLITRLKRTDHVKFWGHQPFQQLPEFYRQCDLMLAVPIWDPCPNVVIEAMSCGLPVLGAHSGGLPELVRDAGQLIEEPIPIDYLDHHDFRYLPQVNPAQYAEAALRILADLPAYQAHAREVALNHFDIRQTAKQYVTAAEQTLNLAVIPG
jgi:glycosyltransferase involved in cell wall biosynthesis